MQPVQGGGRSLSSGRELRQWHGVRVNDVVVAPMGGGGIAAAVPNVYAYCHLPFLPPVFCSAGAVALRLHAGRLPLGEAARGSSGLQDCKSLAPQ